VIQLLQALDIGDDRLDLIIAQPALVGRHYGVIALDDLRLWLEDGLAYVSVVGLHLLPVRQLHSLPIETLPGGASKRPAISGMA